MANQHKIKRVYRFKAQIVFVSIFTILGIMGLAHASVNFAHGQSPTTTNTQIQASNFVVIPIQQHLGDNKSDIFAPSYPYRGDLSDTFNFTLPNTPVGGAYLLVQVYGSYFQGHTIMIDGQEVTGPQGSFGSTGFGNWATLTVLVDDNILKQGQNTIQFVRNPDTPDNFLVDNVVVNWRYQLPQQ
jgi:hypothetical protein